MRITRFRVFLLLGASLLILGPAISLGQPGGPPSDGPPGGFGQRGGGGRRGGRGGGGGGGGGFRMDPNMIFNMMAKGQDVLSVSDYLANPFVQRDPTAKEKMESFMQRTGNATGQLTRDQFAQFMQERMAQRQAERQTQGGAGGPSTPGAPAAEPGADGEDEPVIEDKRPTVYRANNLPKQGLPTWFAQLDEDKDGQVGMYEWKKAGRSQSEFLTWDLNGDGFITVEEAMRVAKTTSGTAVAGGPPTPGSGAPSFGQFSGGPPQGGFGQGNNGGFRRRRNRGN